MHGDHATGGSRCKIHRNADATSAWNTILKVPSDDTDEDAQLLLAVGLFQDGRTSLGAAAELAGLPLRAFIKVLGDRDIPVINYPPSELDDDVSNA